MDLNNIIYQQLQELGLESRECIGLEEIRNKDGIYLYRVEYSGDSYVLKYFDNDKYTREIDNYSILKELEIPTIKVFGFTNRSLLLEDLNNSSEYRLGTASDLSDMEVARALAKWYSTLHDRGVKYIANNKDRFYREIDSITLENLELVRNRSNTADNRVWDLIINNLNCVLSKIKNMGEVLTYNDFYWTNLAVNKDKKEAVMFDYNFLGIGLRYNDIRNVCSSLSVEAGKAFVEEYGGINENEKIIDRGMSILVDLIFAYQRPEFPKWAQKSLEIVKNGQLERDFRRILELI